MSNIDPETGEIVIPEEPAKVLTPDEILILWEVAARQLAEVKLRENDLRKQYVALVTDPKKKSGTENIELGNGYKAVIVKKQNYNVDQDKVNAALDKIENHSPEGKVLADRLIKWKAELSKTEYDQLPSNYKEIIDTCISITDGTPTLNIVAPKSVAKR